MKARISVMAKRIWLKFGMKSVLPRGSFHRKICLVPFRHYRVTDASKRHLLCSCIIHTCLSRARTGCTWPHDPLSCVLITQFIKQFIKLSSYELVYMNNQNFDLISKVIYSSVKISDYSIRIFFLNSDSKVQCI